MEAGVLFATQGARGACEGVESRKIDARMFFPCIGLALFLAIDNFFLWGVDLPFASADLGQAASSVLAFRVSAAASIAVSSFLLGACPLITNRLSFVSRVSFWTATTLLCVAWVLFFATSLAASPALASASGVFTGASHGVFFVLWGTVLASRSFRTNVVQLIIAGAASAIMGIVFSLAPSDVSFFAVGLLLAPASVLLWFCLGPDRPVESGRSAGGQGAPPMSFAQRMEPLRSLREVVGPLACVGALGFSFNAVREVAFSDFGFVAPVNLVSLLGLLAGSALIAALAGRSTRYIPPIELIYPPVALALSAMLILVPFTDFEYRAAFNAVMGAIYPLAVTLLLASFARIAERRRADAIVVFGIGSGALYTVTGAGSLACWALGDGQVAMETLSVVLVVFLALYLLSVPLALTQRRRRDRRRFPAAPDDFKAACDEVARRYGVTEGEKPVMALLAQGHTVAAVASRLNLAESTIRSHSKAIYRKLGVHSKQELIDLVAAECRGL